MNILLRSMTLATVVFTPAVAHASPPLFAATPLTDAELEEARGGFTLPGGATFDIGAIISTSIDGVKVLTSQLNFNNNSNITGSVQTSTGVQASVNGVGNITQSVTGTVSEAVGEITTAIEKLVGSLDGLDQGVAPSSTTGSTVSVGNSSTPITSTPTITDAVVPTAMVNDVINGATNLADQLGSQTADALVDAGGNVSVAVNMNVAPNPVATTAVPGAAVADAANQALSNDLGNTTNSPTGAAQQFASATAGTINVPASSATVNGTNYMNSTVQMADLLIKHSLGSSISSLVVNTADNRVIDTQLAINIRLDNVQPQSIGSIGFRVDALGIDASTWRASR